MKSQRIRPSELLKLRKETGLSYWDLVGNPLPKIEEYGNGKSASNFLMATTGPYSDVIDDTIDQYLAAGWTPTEVAGLVGNVALESGFNPNAVDSAGYRGLYQMSRDMHNSYNQVASSYKKRTGKNYSYTLFIDDMMRGNSRIPSRWITYGKGYLGRNWKSPEAAANAFMNIFERPNPKYANKVGRQANAADAYLYILRRLLNKLMGLLGVEQSDATRVAKPVIQVSRLRKPKQTEDAPIILLQDDEPTAPIQDVPITSGFTLPNPIQLYNNIFGTNLPTMNRGKDFKKVEKFDDGTDDNKSVVGGTNVPVTGRIEVDNPDVKYLAVIPETEVIGKLPERFGTIDPSVYGGNYRTAFHPEDTRQFLNVALGGDYSPFNWAPNPFNISEYISTGNVPGMTEEAAKIIVPKILDRSLKLTGSAIRSTQPYKNFMLSRAINKEVNNGLSQKAIDDLAKEWYNRQLTFAAPYGYSHQYMDAMSRLPNLLGRYIDFGYKKYGGRIADVDQLTNQQLYDIATSGGWKKEQKMLDKLVHIDETGPQPVSKTGFVAKDATNSDSGWITSTHPMRKRKGLHGIVRMDNSDDLSIPQIWWEKGKPYYNAFGKPRRTDIKRTIVSDLNSLQKDGVVFNSDARNIYHGIGEVPFKDVEFGVEPNPWGWFDYISFHNHGKDSGIHIKPSHRGRFTRYLKNHPGMTALKAKHSKSASVRRMATFALNARKWNN